jgi:hypothetical protein
LVRRGGRMCGGKVLCVHGPKFLRRYDPDQVQGVGREALSAGSGFRLDETLKVHPLWARADFSAIMRLRVG